MLHRMPGETKSLLERLVQRVTSRLKFLLERFVVRGPLYRLLVVAGMVVLLSVAGGLTVFYAGEFDDGGRAIWWAFLRLTDPGYLGDDQGTVRRTVSTALTVLGYVVFLGALIAIMTQWFNARMRHLEQGLTPIAQRHHLLVLGWTDRTPRIVRELLASQARVKRFLRRRGAGRRVNIVVLAEDVDAELMQELRERLGKLWNSRRITLRSGSPLRIDHLQRVDFRNAAAIVLPATEIGQGGVHAADTRAVKILLSIAGDHGTRRDELDERDLPLVVAELFDARRIGSAYEAYRGPLEILSSNQVIARLLAHNIRHAGLSHVHHEILSHGEGNELYVREVDGFEGAPVTALAPGFPSAIVLGLIRSDNGRVRALLDPSAAPKVRQGDRLVLLAPGWDATEPIDGFRPTPGGAPQNPAPRPDLEPERRVLVLGWNHRVPAFLQELESYEHERFEVCVASTVPTAERQAALAHHDLRGDRVTVHHEEIDYTVPNGMEKAAPASFDNVVMVASDWLPTGEESDARTILGHLLVRQLAGEEGPRTLVELTDEENIRLFSGSNTEILLTSVLVSHMLAQVAFQRELRVVFDELFGPGGPEIFLRATSDYGLTGRAVTFTEVQEAVADRGDIALGLRIAAEHHRHGGVTLNPPRHERRELDAQDEVVVLTAY